MTAENKKGTKDAGTSNVSHVSTYTQMTAENRKGTKDAGTSNVSHVSTYTDDGRKQEKNERYWYFRCESRFKEGN